MEETFQSVSGFNHIYRLIESCKIPLKELRLRTLKGGHYVELVEESQAKSHAAIMKMLEDANLLEGYQKFKKEE